MQYNGLCTFLVNRALQPHQRCPHFDIVVRLARSYEPESYAGSSLATGRVSHARQVKGDGPDKKNTLVLQVGGQ